jgi:hypothetical protein
MAEINPPQLGDIPQHSELNVPTLSTTGSTSGAPPPAEASAVQEPSTSSMSTENIQNQAQYAKDAVVNSEVGPRSALTRRTKLTTLYQFPTFYPINQSGIDPCL